MGKVTVWTNLVQCLLNHDAAMAQFMSGRSWVQSLTAPFQRREKDLENNLHADVFLMADSICKKCLVGMSAAVIQLPRRA